MEIYLTFIGLFIFIIVLIYVWGSLSPVNRTQQMLRPLVTKRLSDRVIVPVEEQMLKKMNEEEMEYFLIVITNIASTLSIQPGQLRLAESFYDFFVFNEVDLPPDIRKLAIRAKRNQDEVIMASFFLCHVTSGLEELYGRHLYSDLGFENDDDFEDFMLLNSVECVVTLIALSLLARHKRERVP